MPAKLRSGSATISPADMRGFERGVGILEDDLQVLRRWRICSADSVVSSSPSSCTEPEVGSIRRTTDLAVVVLPQPDSPTSASVSPRATVNETSSTAWIGGGAWPNQRLGREVVLAQLLDREQGRGAHGAASSGTCSAMRPSAATKQATPWPRGVGEERRLLDAAARLGVAAARREGAAAAELVRRRHHARDLGEPRGAGG